MNYKWRDPYLENGCGNLPPLSQRAPGKDYCGEFVRFGQISDVPAGLDSKVGEEKDWAMRGQLRFRPSGVETDWTLMLQGSRLRRDSGLGQAIGTGDVGDELGQPDALGYRDKDIQAEEDRLLASGLSDSEAARIITNRLVNRPLDKGPYRGDYNRLGQTRLDTFFASLRGSAELGELHFESKSAYAQYDRYDNVDQDLTPNTQFETIIEDDAWQFFQELSITGEMEDASLTWDVGSYYLMEELNFEQDQFRPSAFSETRREFEQKDWSFGIWAGFTYELYDDITLEAGGRYNWERKTFDITQRRPLVPKFLQEGSFRETWDAPTWVISLTYDFSNSASSYVKVSRGWKAGYFNSNNAKGGFARPERVDSFEWGLNLALMEDRLSLRSALFYYDYQDYQVFQIEDEIGAFPTLEIRNANDATVFGAEVDMTLSPLLGLVPEAIEQLTIKLRGGWLDTEFLDFTDTELRIAGPSAFPIEADFSGNVLPSSPKFQISGSLDWKLDLGRLGVLVPRYDFSWTDDVAFDPADGRGSINFKGEFRHAKFAIGQRAYALHHVRLTYQLPARMAGEIEVAGWCRNLTDERYKTFAADLSSFQKTTLNFVGDPRSCGADMSFAW
jgi:iron complex outermembrane receptor protein